MACPVTVGVPTWGLFSVLMLLFWHDRAWRPGWWLWVLVQAVGWWSYLAGWAPGVGLRYALEAVCIAGIGVAAARVWYLLTIERRTLPGFGVLTWLTDRFAGNPLQDPVAMGLKGVLLGLVVRNLGHDQPAGAAPIAVAALILVGWLAFCAAWRRARRTAPVGPVRPALVTTILTICATLAAGAGRPDLGDALRVLAVVAGGIVLLLFATWSLVRLRLWNERFVASRLMPEDWKRRRLQALRRLAVPLS